MNRLKNTRNFINSELEQAESHTSSDISKAELSPVSGYQWRNWAATHRAQPKYFFQPSTLPQIRQILQNARESDSKIKIVGASHSPNDIAVTNDVMVNLDHFNRILHIDPAQQHVRVQAGIRIFQLNEMLLQNGLALNCLGSISDQSIAGTISTGTHGTGIKFGTLATQIVEMDLLLASGELMTLSETQHRDIFKAALCGLGVLGIIVHVTIACESAFKLHISEYPMPFEALMHEIRSRDLIHRADHFRFFWIPHTSQCYVWEANRTQEAMTPTTSAIVSFKDKLVGYHLLQFFYWCSLFFPRIIPFINKTYRYLMFRNPSDKVAQSFHGFNFDCLFSQYVSEWAIPLENMEEALRGLQALIAKHGFAVHFPVEVRFVAKDDILLSPCYQRDTCFIGIIMYRPYNASPPFRHYFSEFEHMMLHLGGRPHWAKAITFKDFRFQDLYPEWQKFRKIRDSLDPAHLFENEYTKRVLDQEKPF